MILVGNIWLRDPKTKEKSVTLTIFVLAAVVAIFKLLVSGVALGSYSMSAFSGTEFAAVLASVGAIYWGRKNTDSKKD